MDRDLEIEKARSMTATTSKEPQAPVHAAISRNSELIETILKQVENLATRLEHASASEPGDSAPSDGLSSSGSSSLANRIHGQGNNLATISDQLSYITRILEI